MSNSYGVISNIHDVNLDTAANNDQYYRDLICYITNGGNEYNDKYFGARVSSIFVVLVVSTAVTFFPVLATRQTKVKIPLYVYLFARYFGAGVIVATAFIHLLEPAYEEIGWNTCVGLTGGWAEYTWPPAIALTSALLTFLMEFASERYVEKKYALPHAANDAENHVRAASVDAAMANYSISKRKSSHQALHSADQDQTQMPYPKEGARDEESNENSDRDSIDSEKEKLANVAFRQQISAFLILEFGVIFHSVIIGLTLATSGEEFKTLYPVIVFHQSFEGLGIGARLSAIPFPRNLKWMPWVLCAAYGLTTPIAISIGMGVRTTYAPGSYTASIVSGVLDSTSAGILIYTGFVELIARDFLFNPDRSDDDRMLAFMVTCLFLGAGIMALLGKWA